MKVSPLVSIGVLVAIAMLVFIFKSRGQGILPPHEFAYGTALVDSKSLPVRVEQFLSLDEIDPAQIQIQTFAGNDSQKNLKPLIAYISAQKRNDLSALVANLREIDELPNQKEKVIQCVKILLPYKDVLKDESHQDYIIVFVYYGLKQPSKLSTQASARIGDLVKQLDTAKQAAVFMSGECPKNFLVGNINVYPLGLDNTSWHSTAKFASPDDAPVLEIRFMGLRGIFKYLLDEMTAKTGDTFVHLDGESI
jgi:hypothetical protein